MASFRLPAFLISVLSDILSTQETHKSMDSLFSYAGAPGEPPDGSKPVKAEAWLRRLNTDPDVDTLEVLGRLIESYMEPAYDQSRSWGDSDNNNQPITRIKKALERANLTYNLGGRVSTVTGSPTKSLKDVIRKLNYKAIDEEFDRAIRNVDSNPREAVSAAGNILETICKTYIETMGLAMPKKQDLQPVWKVVRKDLGLDASAIEDRDLKEILSGMFATVNGIGALRTHASSAHGSGIRSYKLKPRHARLAIHASHTMATFILESWQEKKQ